MLKLISARPSAGFRVYLTYDDGSEGEVDLSDLVGLGVFRLWEAPGTLERVHVAPHGALAWNDEVELCPDSMYLRLTGKSVEELFPRMVIIHRSDALGRYREFLG